MKNAYWSLLIPTLLLGCQPNAIEPSFDLTPATQTGANTVSFRMDRRVWQPYGRRCFGSGGGPCIETPMDAYYNPRRGQFQITAFLTTSNRAEDFSLDCDSLFQTGVFAFPPSGPIYRARSGGLTFSEAQRPGDPSYKTYDPNRTRIEITRLDTVARIISGVFQGYLEGTINRGQTVSITEGRFDVKY
ncbi:MAG: hypothetical protein JWR44_603 [Hymenobacter sp.]|jgi:hypothetical protein|nr:hypothetical protein [Hymenobacter sp.]